MSNVKQGKLSQFKPTKRNSNKHTPQGMKALDNSMAEDGYTAPMTAAADGEVIDGDARLETAFNRFGDEALIIEHDGSQPVIMVRTDIPDAEAPAARRIHYRANLTAWQNLDLDPEIVMADIEGGFDFGAIDISDLDLGELGIELEKPEPKETIPQTTVTEAEKYHEIWNCQPGQVWQLGEHIIACLDSLKQETWELLLKGKKPSFVFADPPYGINIVAANVSVGGGEAYDIPFGGVKGRKGYVGGAHDTKTNTESTQSKSGLKKNGLAPPKEPSRLVVPMLEEPTVPLTLLKWVNIIPLLVMTA